MLVEGKAEATARCTCVCVNMGPHDFCGVILEQAVSIALYQLRISCSLFDNGLYFGFFHLYLRPNRRTRARRVVGVRSLRC